MGGMEVMCCSAGSQSHQICSVQCLCVITDGAICLPQGLIGSSLHLILSPPVLRGHQLFVLTGTATSGAGSRTWFTLGLWGSPVPSPSSCLESLLAGAVHHPLLSWHLKEVPCVPWELYNSIAQQTSVRSHVAHGHPFPGGDGNKIIFMGGWQYPGSSSNLFCFIFFYLPLSAPVVSWGHGCWHSSELHSACWSPGNISSWRTSASSLRLCSLTELTHFLTLASCRRYLACWKMFCHEAGRPGVRKARTYVFKPMLISIWMNSCSPDDDPQPGVVVRLFRTLAKWIWWTQSPAGLWSDKAVSERTQ